MGRQLGSSSADIQPALEQAQQVLLATGDQGFGASQCRAVVPGDSQ